ncbi:MAG: sel1 repeat family protein [Myxococcales bacterium]|nr:sel1 repeat family protein [Myxococcales bacterium]
MGRVRLVLGSVAAIALGAVACGGGKNAGSAVRPKEITAADALGGGGKGGAGGTCAATDDDRALIIDLADEDRKAIEEMVKVGRVPIVAYDCKSLKLLERCKLQAQFAYTSSGLRDKVISIENSDAAEANLPLASANLRASVASGLKVDLALAEVGSKSSTFELVARPELVGDRGASDCAGASHFIHKVDVGAFALAQRTSGEARAAGQIFTASASGESKSDRSSTKVEGRIESCKTATDADEKAPTNCGIPIRVHLRRIEEQLRESAPEGPRGPGARAEGDDAPAGSRTSLCPGDKVRSEEGVCVKLSPNVRHVCRGDDLADCESECKKGVTESCLRQAEFHLFGKKDKGGTVTPRDPAAAAQILERTCASSQREPQGCALLASALTSFAPGRPAPGDDAKAKAVRALELGCKKSDARACLSLGSRLSGSSLGAADPERGLYYYDRACALGDASGCIMGGRARIEGRKGPNGADLLKKDPAKGVAILDRACKENSVSACSALGQYLTDGRHMPKDAARAATLFGEVCKRGSSFGCVELALLQLDGTGTTKDPAAAKATLEKHCYDGKLSSACYGVARLAERGEGGATPNPAKAVEYYIKYKYTKDAAARAAALLESGAAGKADPTQLAELHRQACYAVGATNGAPCRKAAAHYEGDNPMLAWGLYRNACRLDPKDKVACTKSKAPPPRPLGPPPGHKPQLPPGSKPPPPPKGPPPPRPPPKH